MAIIESCLTILGATSGAATLHSWFTGFKIGDQIQKTLNEQATIRSEIQRLSDHILYAPSIKQVSNLNEPSSQISDLRNLREILDPVQNSLKEDILSTAIISTPDKLREAFKKDPWEVLFEIRPATRTRRPSNPDLVAILFTDDGIPYIGWQTRGALPLLFNCNYSPDFSSGISENVTKKTTLLQETRLIKSDIQNSNESSKSNHVEEKLKELDKIIKFQEKWKNEAEKYFNNRFGKIPNKYLDNETRRKAEKLYQEGLSEKVGGFAIQKMKMAAELWHIGAIKYLVSKGLHVDFDYFNKDQINVR